MATSLIELGTLFGLVSASLLAGVGEGVSLTVRGFHIDLWMAILSGAIVCSFITALIEQLVLPDGPYQLPIDRSHSRISPG